MTNLKVRKVEFDLDETVPFQWLPQNPGFGLFGNAISFFAPPFERFIVATVREAMPLITDPEVQREAEDFMHQEAFHSKAHKKHVGCLLPRYPGLQQTVAECDASFERLLKTESLAYRLAYIANIEATFTPLFKLLLDHEQELFRLGDDRVASLLLWHFVEEIEHRCSALIIYNAVTHRPLYRLSQVTKVFGHVKQVYDIVLSGFDAHVPFSDRGADARSGAGRLVPPGTTSIRRSEVAGMVWRLALSQMPYHNPAHQPLPSFAGRWFAAYDDGMDYKHFYTSGAGHSPAE